MSLVKDVNIISDNFWGGSDHTIPLGQKMKRISLERNKSVKFVSKRIGVHFTTVYNWYRGEIIPTLEHFLKWCLIMGVSPNFVLLNTKEYEKTLQDLSYHADC